MIGSTYPRHEADYAVPWLRETVRRLTERDHEVTVLAPAYAGLGRHRIDGVPVERFRYAPRGLEHLTHEQGAPNRIRKPIYQALGAPYVALGAVASARLALRKRFDVIHAHWPFPHGPIAAAARAACGAPIVANCHGAEFAMAARKTWVQPLLRRALVGADRLLANSRHTAERVHRMSGREAEVIPYGTTVRARPTPAPRNPVPRILFTGRLIQRKGVEYLIRAMPHILASGPASLQITGDGDCRAGLECLTRELGLADSVQFLGFVDNKKLDALYAGCDVYVNPSIIDDNGDTEGLGVGPIEAFCHGRPVVASAVGGIVDVVIHERTGLLVPEKDPERLAGAIRRLIERPLEAKALAQAGLEYARRHFDWDRIVESLVDVYHGAIAERGSRGRSLTFRPASAPLGVSSQLLSQVPNSFLPREGALP
ncbi:MAG: glycosyltransferase family 4 protein [Isosphaeraceae bacterium]